MEYILIGILLILSALFSGLTIGLMSLDLTTIRIKTKQGDTNAAKVLGLRENGTQLLVTLLLANTFVNSVLAILMSDNFGGVAAGLLTTALIFLFGEVLPQAVLTRHALSFGSKAAPFVKALIFVSYPLTRPITFVIEKVLGQEMYTRYTKKDILEIIDDEKAVEVGSVDTDEKRIVRGSLSFSHKTAADVLTPSIVVEAVHHNDIIDQAFLDKVKEAGYSRLPVKTDDHNHIVGILYLKDLLGVHLPTTVEKQMDTTVHFINSKDLLDKVLNDFIKNNMHLFIVQDDFGIFQGVITLEDVLEEIIGAEIMDEDDEDADLRAVALANRKKARR